MHLTTAQKGDRIWNTKGLHTGPFLMIDLILLDCTVKDDLLTETDRSISSSND